MDPSALRQKRPTVSIIVVTMNTPKITRACLDSVRRHTTVPYELIVINNSRAQAILDCLKKFRGIQVIQNFKNLGYAKAANQGALHSRGEFLCFLNSDTWVPPGWLERLLDAARLPGVGAVSPLSEWERYRRLWPSENQAVLENFTLMTDKAFQKWHTGRTKMARWLCGFCLMIPRVVMARLGFFDERFFFGWEDIDYSLRLRLKGYRLLKVESLFIHHKRGASSSVSKHKKLVREAQKQFLSKWSAAFGVRLRSDRAVFATVDQRVRPGSKKQPLRKKTGARRRSGFIRAGYAIRSEDGRTIEALVRWSDLEMFSLDDRRKKVWEFFDAVRGKTPLEPFLTQELAKRLPPRLVSGPILITVMMPAHNAERWIAEAIESVLTQHCPNFELIVTDDGSTDRTAEIACRYVWHPRFRFFSNKRQMGIPAARNRILSLARGRYIAVCDADDMMRPTLLSRFTGLLEKNPSMGWIYADRLDLDERGRFIGSYPALPMDGSIEYKRNVMQHAGAVIRRELILKVGGYDESFLTEDYDLAFKVARRARIVALSGESHYLYRRHQDNASRLSLWTRRERDLLARRERYG